MLDLDETLLEVARQWVQKAENDLRTSEHLLRLRRDRPNEVICFHAQQCAEKYLKALLIINDVEFPRTHQLSTLLALIPAPVRPELTPEEQEALTEYAVTTRYPGDYEPISDEEARRAVQIARRLRVQVRRRLPETVWR